MVRTFMWASLRPCGRPASRRNRPIAQEDRDRYTIGLLQWDGTTPTTVRCLAAPRLVGERAQDLRRGCLPHACPQALRSKTLAANGAGPRIDQRAQGVRIQFGV